jgi:hypothetical protein
MKTGVVAKSAETHRVELGVPNLHEGEREAAKLGTRSK